MKLWNKVFGGKYPPKAIMGTGLAISFSGVPVLACGVLCPPLLIPGAILYLGGSGIDRKSVV